MNILFVVSESQDWPDDIPGVTVLPAQTYLMDPAYGDIGSTKVFNLCRTYRYQEHGYYVSLLAEARGHAPVPNVQAMKALHAANLVLDITEKLGKLIDCSFAQTAGEVADIDIYFGRDAAQEHLFLSGQLFQLLNVPVLHVRFERVNARWHLCSIYSGNVRDIPLHQQRLVTDAAIAHLHEQKIRTGTLGRRIPSLAILHDPTQDAAPSNPAALQKFREAAERLGMHAEFITPQEIHRLTLFDAVFIRDTTNVNHYTYEVSRQAADAGMIVIDDPDSILRCTNKIYLDELLARNHIPTPKTLVVHKGNVREIVSSLGLPCILKQPDGAFSRGVVKIEEEDRLMQEVNKLMEESELILAQEYVPTDFDWRIGVLDHRPLFVCKYYMAPGHWQIIHHDHHCMSEGRIETFSVGEAPDEVIEIAIKAANLIGDGFYGVDIKQSGCQYYVIEINDNPNVDCGNEDAVLADALYREVMGVFRKRIDAQNGNTNR